MTCRRAVFPISQFKIPFSLIEGIETEIEVEIFDTFIDFVIIELYCRHEYNRNIGVT